VTKFDADETRPDQLGGAEPFAPGSTPPVIPTSMTEVREFIDLERSMHQPLSDHEVDFEMEAFRGRGRTVVDLARRAPFGWWPVAVLALVSLIDRMEQSVLAGVLSSIQEEFGIGDALAGLLASGAGFAALLLVIPAGFIADRVVRTKAIALILVLWSLLSLGTGLAANFAILFGFRLILGGASVLNNPMSGSLLGDFYPRAARGKAYGIERLFYFLGNPIGIIAAGIIAEVFGWRWVFLGLVPAGLIVAALVYFLKEPNRGLADGIDIERDRRGLNPQVEEKPERKRDADDVDLLSGSVWRDMLGLFKARTLRLVLISQGLLFLGLGGLFFWTPTYFQRAYSLEEGASAGIAGGIGLIGILIGFGVGLRFQDKYQGIKPGWRVLLGSIGASIGAVGLFVMATSPILPLSILGWLTVNIGFFLSVPAFTASLADLSGASRRGLVFALSTLVIQATSSLAPGLIGGISQFLSDQGLADTSTSLRVAFSCLVIPVVIGIVVALKSRSTYDAEADDARRGDALTV
jgi:MFS family permease